ncbi:MAG: hydantoinase B/oxoprolinase family protein [Parvibaculales bacterium]
MQAAQKKWRFLVDRGGTFTDVIALSPQDKLHIRKFLSQNDEKYKDATLYAIRNLLNIPDGKPLPKNNIGELRIATTIATNALLEKKGAKTALLITKGHKDALEIGNQTRPDLFSLTIEKPKMLYKEVLEIEERLSAQGEVLQAPSAEQIKAQLEYAKKSGCSSLAICFLHSYRFPAHEQYVAGLAKEMGFSYIATSHETIALMKFVPRAATTLADAYLSPILQSYIQGLEKEIQTSSPDTKLHFMMSNGGLCTGASFRGKDAIVSGPAGGVIGAIEAGKRAGLEKIIGFDMGGTSTDICHYSGKIEQTLETKIGGIPLRTPMMQIHTIAAGGGSIISYETGRVQIGPQSAGANPGPLSYRKGGPLTLTDANICVGKIRPDRFPAIFGKTQNKELDEKGVEKAFGTIAKKINIKPEQLADGAIKIGVENMAHAIKKISTHKGHDVSQYALTCFGGAAGQFACLVADALYMEKVLIPPLTGLLSAWGLGLARMREGAEQSVELPLSELDKIEAEIEGQKKKLTAQLSSKGEKADEIFCYLLLRYEGTDSTIEIAHSNKQKEIEHGFEQSYAQQFGFIQKGKKIIIEAIRLEAFGERPPPLQADVKMEQQKSGKGSFFSQGKWHDAEIFARNALQLGKTYKGPLLIFEEHANIIVEQEWQAERTKADEIILTRPTPRKRDKPLGIGAREKADPILLEIFNNLFMSIAEQMGAVLEKTASSVNIKERLDFSCALFDEQGGLIANAPHMPVHLGSMGASVQAIMRNYEGKMAEGEAYILNDPYAGGTHLPDVTIILPIFIGKRKRPAFYVASRGHHADIGGITPGSMPAHSSHIDEEGVLFSGEKLLEKGIFAEEKMRHILSHAQYPSRNIEQNLADFRAQLAACEKGKNELLRQIEQYGEERVLAYTGHVQQNAAEHTRQTIMALQDGSFSIKMDAGTKICVSLKVDKNKRRLSVDFSGTSPMQKNNFNAPQAICRACVLYVFRTMVQENIPMNEGCLEPLDIIIPPESLLSPHHPAAVVAGNVETSQAICDALFGALGIMAASQGTMNNLTFGNEQYQYYETLCGGTGAGHGFAGASGVHSHMTNSRLTDIEILEWRFPVRLEHFGLRKNTGGAGKWRGGDGVERRLLFLEDMHVSLLTQRRLYAPFGLAGGGEASKGENILKRKNGEEQKLESCSELEIKAGEKLIIKTPGGGGFGS